MTVDVLLNRAVYWISPDSEHTVAQKDEGYSHCEAQKLRTCVSE